MGTSNKIHLNLKNILNVFIILKECNFLKILNNHFRIILLGMVAVMRSLLKISSFFILLNIILSASTLNSIYNVSEGLEVSYEIVHSEIDAEIEDAKFSGNGFVLEGQVFECKEIVTTEVVSVSDFSICWKIKKNDFSETYYITTLGYYNRYIDFLSATINTAIDLIDDWENSQYKFGYGLPLFPFIDPSEDTWDYLSNIGKFMSYTIGNTTSSATKFKIDCDFDYWEESDNIYVEGYNGGKIDGLLYLNDFDITYESLLLSSYEKSTGILNGMRIAGFCVGTINSIEVDFVINFYCLRLGYSLPYFQFGTKNYDTKNSSFDISICFISVFIIAIIERKCKKNR